MLFVLLLHGVRDSIGNHSQAGNGGPQLSLSLRFMDLLRYDRPYRFGPRAIPQGRGQCQGRKRKISCDGHQHERRHRSPSLKCSYQEIFQLIGLLSLRLVDAEYILVDEALARK